MSDPALTHFLPGRTVLRREMLHGLPWLEAPVTVLRDDETCLAVTVMPGARFTFFEHPFGRHPWAAHEAWSGSTVLQLHRDDELYAVLKFFDRDQRFTHWYLNFQEPALRRVDASGAGAFETADLGLDIVIPGDGSAWYWKDVDDPDAMVTSGRITAAERERLAVQAQRVASDLSSGNRWWSQWDDWCP